MSKHPLKIAKCPMCERPTRPTETDDDGYHAECRPFCRRRPGGRFQVVFGDGHPATCIPHEGELSGGVYPEGSFRRCHQDHPDGIYLTRAQVDHLNLEIEDDEDDDEAHYYSVEEPVNGPERVFLWFSEADCLRHYSNEAWDSDGFLDYLKDNDWDENDDDAVWAYAAHDLVSFARGHVDDLPEWARKAVQRTFGDEEEVQS